MSRRVDFYTISVNRNGIATDYSISAFFENIYDSLHNNPGEAHIIRKIGEKFITHFRLLYAKCFTVVGGELESVCSCENDKKKI